MPPPHLPGQDSASDLAVDRLDAQGRSLARPSWHEIEDALRQLVTEGDRAQLHAGDRFMRVMKWRAGLYSCLIMMPEERKVYGLRDHVRPEPATGPQRTPLVEIAEVLAAARAFAEQRVPNPLQLWFAHTPGGNDAGQAK